MKSPASKPEPSPRARRSIRTAAWLAVAFALFGATTYAASALPKNSVGTKQLKNGAVTTNKLKNGAVTAAKVKSGSLTGAQINVSTLGTVPNAAHANQADSAGRATNSDQLGGLSASAFQLRVTGSCSGGHAITGVNADGSVGCAGAGGPPSGPAGGALTGSYPNPTLNVTGGPCPNGQALIDVSPAAELTCATGVYSDESDNVAVTLEPFPGSGAENSALGSRALEGNESGERNSAFGHQTLTSNTTGSDNSAVGDSALFANTTGVRNSAVGAVALFHNTSGQKNSAFGVSALFENTTGNQNSAVGDDALGANTEGEQNSAFGANALRENTTGNTNTAAGEGAMSLNTEGNENSAFGQTALFNNQTGSKNSAFGQHAMGGNMTGEENVALGGVALSANTSGKRNVAIGFQAGNALTIGNDNIDIGTYVSGPAGESETIRIGTQGTQKKAFLAGVKATPIAGSPVVVTPSGQLGEEVSSRRFKRDIRPLNSRIDGLMALRPVSFRYRHSIVPGPNQLHFGLIAEQVAKVYPNLVAYGRDGKPTAVAYQELPALLLAQAQRQQVRMDRQQAKIRGLQRDNIRLQAQSRHQQAQINWLMRRVRGR